MKWKEKGRQEINMKINVYFCDICNKQIDPDHHELNISRVDESGQAHKLTYSVGGVPFSLKRVLLCDSHSQMLRQVMREERIKFIKKTDIPLDVKNTDKINELFHMKKH